MCWKEEEECWWKYWRIWKQYLCSFNGSFREEYLMRVIMELIKSLPQMQRLQRLLKLNWIWDIDKMVGSRVFLSEKKTDKDWWICSMQELIISCKSFSRILLNALKWFAIWSWIFKVFELQLFPLTEEVENSRYLSKICQAICFLGQAFESKIRNVWIWWLCKI